VLAATHALSRRLRRRVGLASAPDSGGPGLAFAPDTGDRRAFVPGSGGPELAFAPGSGGPGHFAPGSGVPGLAPCLDSPAASGGGNRPSAPRSPGASAAHMPYTMKRGRPSASERG
jgi:hypothetical protein